MIASKNYVATIGQLHSRELLHKAEDERPVRLAREGNSSRWERFVMWSGDLLMPAGVWLMVRSLVRKNL